ncbi:MAG: DNA glycosylase AlkZ-like family protein [Janthinobacterium lividum]
MSRAQVLAFRAHAQQLTRSRDAVPAHELAITELGVLDVPTPAAATAIALRGGDPDDELVLVWGVRGAPALHRRADLGFLTAAMWPLSDTDATRRINNPRITEGTRGGLAALAETARAVHAVLSERTGRFNTSELSQGVTTRIRDALSYDCLPCGARHVAGSVLQNAGLAGGAELLRDGRSTEFRLLPGVEVPERATGTDELVRRYLRLLGPATPADVATYLGTSTAELNPVWPDDVSEVSVEGRTGWQLNGDVDALLSAPPLDLVRLLPPGDPWLQARDRDLVLPEKVRRSAVWKAIAAPGILLVDGEITGTWRARTTGTTTRRADVSVTGFEELAPRVVAALAAEIPFIATGRGVEEARLSVEDG